MPSSQNGRVRLIVNGKSANRPELDAAIDTVHRRGHGVQVMITRQPGDTGRFAADAAAGGTERIVAAGGDGTINEIVSALVEEGGERPPAIGVVPFGTANDFATGCRIPTDDPLAALLLALEGDPTPIDVGRVNGRCFVNVATAGFPAEVTANTPEAMKQRIGGAAYALQGLITAMKLRPYPATIVWDDREEQRDFIVATIGNGSLAGGGFEVAPTALLDDGLFDVMTVPDFAITELGTVVADLGKRGSEPREIITYRRVQAFELHCSEPVPLNIDGEPLFEKDYCFRVMPAALPFILPDDAPLSDREATT